MDTLSRHHDDPRGATDINGLKLTTRGQHAVMALIELAGRNKGEQSDKPVPLAEIAEARKISLSYLEQLFAGLRRHGLVKSARGPGGGYRLAKAPSDISIAAVFIAAEDSVPGKRVKRAQLQDSDNQDSHHQDKDTGQNGQNNEQIGQASQVDQSATALWDHIGQTLYQDLSRRSLGDVLCHHYPSLSSQA